MIIAPQEVLDGVKQGLFLHGLGERDLATPEGAGFDLRLGRLAHLGGDSHLGIDERRTPKSEDLQPLSGQWTLEPGQYYLATTLELVDLPIDVAGLVVPRSTLYRSGIIFSGGLAAPGYRGELTVGLFNARSEPCVVELNARFMHIVFIAMSSSGETYRGQWQGGRVSAPDSERQV